jgi:hypothetical protein
MEVRFLSCNTHVLLNRLPQQEPDKCILLILGVFVTREHVRHNKSGITHRGKTRISH